MPDPSTFSSIGWILGSLAALFVAINTVDDFVRRRAQGGKEIHTIEPNPLTVRQEAEYVTRRDFVAMQVEHRRERDQLHAKLGGMERNLREEMKQDVEALHEKINNVALGVARMESESNAHGKILEQMHDDIRELMQRDSRG
jgi:hypothetical protein